MDAEVRVAMASQKEAEIVSKAMSVGEKPGSRSSSSISASGEVLKLKVEATDLGALRAALNSSLREIKIADSVL